jgi:hypothetical protein
LRGDFGYSWWIKPDEGYCAGGRYGQQINFFPERNIVVVYTASLPLASSDTILDTITRAFVLGTEDPPESLNSDAGVEDSCGSTDWAWIENSALAPYASGVSSFGDDVSTRCLTSSENRMCLYGVAADAGTDYENWGAGMALRLAETDDTEEVIAPFNAAAEGIFGVRFTLSGADTLSHGLRAGMTMVDQDGLPFEINAYVVDGSWTGDFKTDGVVSFSFDTLGMPEWTDKDILKDGRDFDPTQIHSLRFQAVTQPYGSYAYNFCISNIEWLNQDLEPVN